MEKRNKRPTKLLWIDLEMTGLDPSRHQIIEVAAIITDFDFNELVTYEAIIHQPDSVLEAADEWVKTTFAANGLLNAVRASDITEQKVEQDLVKLVEHHFGDEAAILAGSSIHQDRRFIRKYWTTLEQKLHYRMLDVTSFKILMMGRHSVYAEKEENHRALEDIRGSIRELDGYIAKMGEGSGA